MNMSFTPSDFSNIRWDERVLVITLDVDLVLERFEELKRKDEDFIFSYTKHVESYKIFLNLHFLKFF